MRACVLSVYGEKKGGVVYSVISLLVLQSKILKKTSVGVCSWRASMPVRPATCQGHHARSARVSFE